MNRRFGSAVVAFATVVVAACGGQKAPATSAGTSGEQKGQYGLFYYVNLSRPVGGTIRSTDGKINCGTGGDLCGPAMYLWKEKAELTAVQDAGMYFQAWAADCSGYTTSCTLDTDSGGADKWVVAVFNPPGQLGHGKIASPAQHAPLFFAFLGNDPGAPRCTNCHGQGYQGLANAPSCNACHAAAGWADWQQSCSFCHGLKSPDTKAGYVFANGGVHQEWAAPPDDVGGRLTGANGSATGAHQAHVAANGVRGPIACSECHTVPATAIHVLNHLTDLPFGPLSRSGGALPTWNANTLTCGSNYCHGNFDFGGIQGKAASLAWTGSLTGCTTCHDMPPAGHSYGGNASASSCSVCHPDTVLPSGAIDLAKGRHINGQRDVTGGACDSCHWFPYPSSAPPAIPFLATGAHLAHYGLAAGQGSTGYGDLDTMEQKFPTAPPSAYAFGCGNCHPMQGSQHSAGTGSSTAKVVLFEAAAPAGSVKSRNTGATFNAPAKTCSSVYCHGIGAAIPAWNSGATPACNRCHGTSTTNGRPDYASGSPKANSHGLHASYGCNACHAGTTANGTTVSNTALHVNGRYDLSPGPGVTFTYAFATTGGTCSNISCHYGGSSTWGPTESHLATLGTGEVMVFEQANTDHGAGFTMPESCTSCHYQSLVTQHAGRCDLCHEGSNPAAALIGNWNKGCSAGSCHPSIHAAGVGSSDHHMMWQNSSSACDRCHDTGSGNFPGPGDNCSRCHNPSLTAGAVGDHQPPTTTAVVTYVNGASVHLAAVDTGTAGISVTWFALDAHGWTLGTDVSVSPPVSGSRTHTVQFYSVDHALNAESVKSVSFTLQAAADTTPPITTSSFNPAAGAIFNASQTVTLSPSDNASGVMATYYKIDSGAFAAGTSFTVSDGLHTFSFYSVDNANNAETVHVSNPFRVDTIAPSTTNSAVSGFAYFGAQTFILAATDANGSGVASTWYRLDGGALTAGTSIPVPAPASGSVSHTIQWYSIDNAGNQEATRSVTFTVQLPVTDTTPPTTTSSFNPAAGAIYKANQAVSLTATDGGSGVKSTSYKIDGGAFVLGTSFTVTGDGLHTFSYYSVDNMNNTETTHVSNSFRIDTIAPSTTNTAVGGSNYTGAQTFTLTATDAGSGVASTWFILDGGGPTSGTSISIPAPASGSVSHTIQWYSIDVAGNQETTKSVTFTVAAPAVGGGTATISVRTNCTGIYGYVWVYWQIRDASGTPIGQDFSYDDCGHPATMGTDFTVPAGVGYQIYGEFSEDSGAIIDSAIQPVAPSQVGNGMTYTWWWY